MKRVFTVSICGCLLQVRHRARQDRCLLGYCRRAVLCRDRAYQYFLLMTLALQTLFSWGWKWILRLCFTGTLPEASVRARPVDITSSDWPSIIHKCPSVPLFSLQECLFRCPFLGVSLARSTTEVFLARDSRTSYGRAGHWRPWQATHQGCGSQKELPTECRVSGRATGACGKAGAGWPEAFFTAQCRAALAFISFVRFRSLSISHRFWGSQKRLERVLSP